MCYVVIYDVALPANAAIYVTEFIKLIEFDVLNPEAIVRLWIPDFELDTFITGVQSQIIFSKDQEANVLKDTKIFILMIAVAILVVGCSSMLVCKFKSKMFNKLKETRKKFFWNGATRSLYLSYMKTLMTGFI